MIYGYIRLKSFQRALSRTVDALYLSEMSNTNLRSEMFTSPFMSMTVGMQTACETRRNTVINLDEYNLRSVSRYLLQLLINYNSLSIKSCG